MAEAGYYVAVARGPDGAWDWAIHKNIKFDMIISDQQMPGEKGASLLTFLSELQEKEPAHMDRQSKAYQAMRRHFSDLSDAEFQALLQNIKVHPHIRVILSGFPEDEGIRQALKAGIIQKFISKKLPVPEILDTICGLFEQQEPK